MYEDLIKRLRETSIWFGELDNVSDLLLEAANTIEELDAKYNKALQDLVKLAKNSPKVGKHGRLIDADALLERFEKEEKAADEHGRDFSFSFKSGGENCTEWWPVQQMLMDAPTIIPAEEGE